MWTIETYSEVYARYEASGLPAKDFCENERITRSRFYYWQKKYRKLREASTLTPRDRKDACPVQFIPILSSDNASGDSYPLSTVSNEVAPRRASSSRSRAFMEIQYVNGTTVRLSGEKDMELIKTLILLSTSASCSV